MTFLSKSSRSARWLFLLFCTAPSVSGFTSWFGGSSQDDTAQNDLVSPIVNRELEVSVVAHDWPFLVDNIYCEAWAYHALKDWDYLDRFVELMSQEPGNKDINQASDIVAKATVHNPSLLQYSLSLRAHSPLCEMHRTLARQVVLNHPKLLSQDAFCVTSRDEVASTPAELASLLGADNTVATDAEELLPDEHVRGEIGSLIIIYANMGSAAFLDLYKTLVESNQRFVLRHRGHVSYEEIGGTATILQGFGARLDIRNVEYRVFDDTSEGNVNEASLLNLSTLYGLTNHTLAGIQVSALTNLQESDAENLQRELWRLHEAQQVHSQLVPPKWQRRQISLQAAIVISRSSDVLFTLQDISQNLPSVASTLVHVGVTEEMKALSDLMEPIIRQSKGVTLTINGRMIPVGRPSFNVFELLQILQEEQQALDDMQRKLSPYLSIAGLQQVQRAWTMGKDSFLSTPSEGSGTESASLSGNAQRIDVGRGWKDAIIYVNDLEKDPLYRQWPRSLQQAMMSMQFGAPPSVRRNLFTMLCVIDPVEQGAGEHPGYSLGNQLMEAQFPARMGYLIINSNDVKECRTWIENNYISDDSLPCPTKPILAKDQSNIQALSQVDASTHAVHRLVTTVATDNAGNGLAVAFMEYFVQYLGQLIDDGDGVVKMSDLVTVFGQLMEGLVGMKKSDAIQMAIDALVEDADERDRVSSYGNSLRFAISKAISPGMGFINGRPLAQGDPASAGQVFAEEQKHVFGLIMKGEITDSAPKSVYAKLLTGEGVFDRLHPLLSVSEKELHLDLDHDFSASSLLFPKSHSADYVPEAVFIAEAVFDLETAEGIAFVSGFLKAMDAYPRTVEIGEDSLPISIGYRVVPLPTSEAIPFCSILANAGMVGAEVISALLSQRELLRKPIEELLALLPNLSTEQKATIKNFSCSISWSNEAMGMKNFVAVNGKAYAPESGVITKDDIDLLVDIERRRSEATTKILKNVLSFDDKTYVDAIVKASTFLAIEHGKVEESQRMDMVDEAIALEKMGGIEINPFRFAWNMDGHDALKIQASVVIDPATEAAQRVAPFLLVFRDILKIPLRMVLVPKSLVGDDSSVPITSYYRFVADPLALPDSKPPKAAFSNLPTNHILTLRLDVPESWNVQQTHSIQDTDNLRCDVQSGCGDDALSGKYSSDAPIHGRRHLTGVEYGLKSLLFFGQCYDASTRSPPNGLQLILTKSDKSTGGKTNTADVSSDGSIEVSTQPFAPAVHSDTLVMKNVGYWQLRANPGVWQLEIAPDSRGAEIFDIVDGFIKGGSIKLSNGKVNNSTKAIFMKDFIGTSETLLVNRRSGFEAASLFYENDAGISSDRDDVIHVFSLATGHLYERFLKIMMLSVTKRTTSKVKFWLFENYLSPSFKGSAKAMADRIGCEVEFVTYKWPEWLRGQSEKQRIIWGYKILFLDVLFPLSVKKIIYVDADQVVRGDLKELWDMDLKGAPYGYTPMCSSRESTLGFQFWKGGFWEQHLRGKPYHISALYVVDLVTFRQGLVGDNLRSVYQQLSADPNSLANLDQDLPNYAQHQVPIFSLPQEWLWCESWCSDDTKATAKTIDLCNNPLHKEPKVNMAKRIISGDLFKESWVELDVEVEGYEKEYLASLSAS